MKFKGIYIPTIDGKDIYISANYNSEDKREFSLKTKAGKSNLRKFLNSLDYSIDLLELSRIYGRVGSGNKLWFEHNGKKYSQAVINVTFKYSVKEWNKIGKNKYIKYGYTPDELEFKDCIAYLNGEVVGIETDKRVNYPLEEINETDFRYDEETKEYKSPSTIPTIADIAQIREYIYKHGFVCDGVKYVRFKRSAGAARVGKCLFIEENLYKRMFKYSRRGIKVEEGQEIDLAAFESYISLSLSSCIDMIELMPENILVVDDYESVFTEDVIQTVDDNGVLKTSSAVAKISNSIWDGESLIDISAMGKYSKYGMVLLRNLMFKSCCFNTNIQQWFADNNITDVSQLNGYTRAKYIEEIKLITTPSSIKYLKFGSLDMWLDNMSKRFGVVKHDKKTHFFEGKLVHTHYQLLNTLQMTKDEVGEFLNPSFDFAQALREDPAVMRYYIKCPKDEKMQFPDTGLVTDSDVVYHMLCINDRVSRTTYYKKFLKDLLASYYKTLKSGKVMVNGNYSTLLGNPIELLRQSIGVFNGQSQIGVGNIHSKRFEYGKTILGSRSPHVTVSNVWLPKNTENTEIDKYLNLTEEIVCINSINENTLQRLSGADFDSDTCLLTDNEILVNAAKRNYNIFKVSTCLVEARKIKRYYTKQQQAELDTKTAVNLIGEIVNLSAVLNSLMWSQLNNGAKYEDVEELYCDICQLNAMSGIEIDSAKKEFNIDNKKELAALREKYSEQLMSEDGRKILPHFFAHISRLKGYYNPTKKQYCKFETTMDYVQTKVNGFRTKEPDNLVRSAPFVHILDPKKYHKCNVNREQITQIYQLIDEYHTDVLKYCADAYIIPTGVDGYLKADIRKQIDDEFINKISKIRIGFSTLYAILTEIEDDENKNRKGLLLRTLFTCKSEAFKQAISKSQEVIGEFYIDDDGDCDFFGIKFYRKKTTYEVKVHRKLPKAVP